MFSEERRAGHTNFIASFARTARTQRAERANFVPQSGARDGDIPYRETFYSCETTNQRDTRPKHRQEMTGGPPLYLHELHK